MQIIKEQKEAKPSNITVITNTKGILEKATINIEFIADLKQF